MRGMGKSLRCYLGEVPWTEAEDPVHLAKWKVRINKIDTIEWVYLV